MQSSNNLSLDIESQLIFQQTILQPEIKLTHIQSNHYFMLINKKSNKALVYKPSKNYYQDHADLAQINHNDIDQIFLIQEIQTDKYQIVHGLSTLVFTRKQSEVMLDFGNWKQSQFFYTQKINTSDNKLQYWIKENKKSDKYLYYDGFALRCQTTTSDDERAMWEIRLCLNNSKLNRSCWIEYAFSNQVIDIPGASEQQGKELIQYPCNYRFNQRFFIEQYKSEDKTHFYNLPTKLFTIQSLKTSQFITVNQGKFSSSVVQQNQKKNGKFPPKQLWIFQYFSNGLYTIRSSLGPKKYLIVKDRSTKNEEPLKIAQNQNQSLWKIVGNFNIMPNKDNRY